MRDEEYQGVGLYVCGDSSSSSTVQDSSGAFMQPSRTLLTMYT